MTTDSEREITWTCMGQTRGTEGEVRKEDAHLLAMNENVDDALIHVIYTAHGGLEVRADVRVSAVMGCRCGNSQACCTGRRGPRPMTGEEVRVLTRRPRFHGR